MTVFDEQETWDNNGRAYQLQTIRHGIEPGVPHHITIGHPLGENA